jgi:hypothetical protein
VIGPSQHQGDVLALDASKALTWSPEVKNVIDRLAALELAIGDPTPLDINGTFSDWLLALSGRVKAIGGDVPPAVEGVLSVDRYSSSFARVFAGDPVLIDQNPHWVTFELATTPGPMGAAFANVNELTSMGGNAYFDNGGHLGNLVGVSGSSVSNIALGNYINKKLLCHIQADLVSDPAHPKMIVLETVDGAAMAGSSLTLDSLADVVVPTTAADNSVLVWDDTSKGWTAQAATTLFTGPDRMVSLAELQGVFAAATSFQDAQQAIASL